MVHMGQFITDVIHRSLAASLGPAQLAPTLPCTRNSPTRPRFRVLR